MIVRCTPNSHLWLQVTGVHAMMRKGKWHLINKYQILAGTGYSIDGSPREIGMALTKLACDPHFRLDLVGNDSCEDFFFNSSFCSRLEHIGFVQRTLESVPEFIYKDRVSPPRCHCSAHAHTRQSLFEISHCVSITYDISSSRYIQSAHKIEYERNQRGLNPINRLWTTGKTQE